MFQKSPLAAGPCEKALFQRGGRRRSLQKTKIPNETLHRMYTRRMRWVVEFLDEEVKAALDAFPPDIRASFQRIV